VLEVILSTMRVKWKVQVRFEYQGEGVGQVKSKILCSQRTEFGGLGYSLDH
jgi:hypothetical protein